MGRRLRALEQSVGQTLFQRTVEGFVLTDEGTAVLSHAERMEEEALAFQRRLAGQDRQFEGMLRVSSSDWFGAQLLAPVLAEFTRAQPRVTRSNNRDVQARLCAEGAGLAVLPRPLGDTLAGVKRIDLGEQPPGRDTFVGYHRDLKRLARLRALLDLVVTRLAD
jgi:DNA-binding transcriptional LysR family regulator